jgi:hypothetical protein
MFTVGISLFIDLTTPEDHQKPYGEILAEISSGMAERYSFGIMNETVPSDPMFIKEILDTIDSGLRDGRNVYVHCWGGVGRTGMAVGCWLKRHGRGDIAALWKTCPKSRKYPISPEAEVQQDFIRSWPESGSTG